MPEYQFVTESFTIWKAIMWCFYQMVTLVGVELLLRAVNDDDDDDQGGGLGVNVDEPQLVPLPQGT
jgi:hypothetical protein